jgi:heterodisulfide reductase subunit B
MIEPLHVKIKASCSATGASRRRIVMLMDDEEEEFVNQMAVDMGTMYEIEDNMVHASLALQEITNMMKFYYRHQHQQEQEQTLST